MEYSNSFNAIRLMHQNNNHYNLNTKKNTELKDIEVPKMTKLMAKNKKAWIITGNPKDNDFTNEEKIVTTGKYETILEYCLSDDTFVNFCEFKFDWQKLAVKFKI